MSQWSEVLASGSCTSPRNSGQGCYLFQLTFFQLRIQDIHPPGSEYIFSSPYKRSRRMAEIAICSSFSEGCQPFSAHLAKILSHMNAMNAQKYSFFSVGALKYFRARSLNRSTRGLLFNASSFICFEERGALGGLSQASERSRKNNTKGCDRSHRDRKGSAVPPMRQARL